MPAAWIRHAMLDKLTSHNQKEHAHCSSWHGEDSALGFVESTV